MKMSAGGTNLETNNLRQPVRSHLKSSLVSAKADYLP